MPGTVLDTGSRERRWRDKSSNTDRRQVQKVPNLRGNGEETRKKRGQKGFTTGTDI